MCESKKKMMLLMSGYQCGVYLRWRRLMMVSVSDVFGVEENNDGVCKVYLGGRGRGMVSVSGVHGGER